MWFINMLCEECGVHALHGDRVLHVVLHVHPAAGSLCSRCWHLSLLQVLQQIEQLLAFLVDDVVRATSEGQPWATQHPSGGRSHAMALFDLMRC
jgi:hypothetical protein